MFVDLSGVRYDEVARVGDSLEATSQLPAFGALVREGAFFTQATASAAWDAPSIAGLLTGLSPDQCTVRGRPADGIGSMIPSIETLAEMLRDVGYATGGFTAGGRISRRTGLAQGFDAWEEIGGDDARLASAGKWLTSLEKDRPRFLFLHASAAPKKFAAHAVSRADRIREVGMFLDAARTLANATRPKDGQWFVVLSDHGDVINEREGGIDEGDTGVLDAQIRVPMAIVGDGFRPGPIGASVSLLDLVPTIRELLGLETRALVEGRSLKPLLDGGVSPGKPALSQAWRRVRTTDNPLKQRVIAVRIASAKFVAAFDVDTGAWTEDLFDLEADPTEVRPIARPTAKDLEARGRDFEHSVGIVREALGQGKALFSDEVTGGYMIRASGNPVKPPAPAK